MSLSNGKEYKGEFSNGQYHGKGSERGLSENYTGEYKNSKKNGKGKITFKKTGNQFEGDFLEGKMNGFGEFKWNTGDKYIGAIKEGVPHGNGIYYWVNGNKFKGNFINGKRDETCGIYLKKHESGIL